MSGLKHGERRVLAHVEHHRGHDTARMAADMSSTGVFMPASYASDVCNKLVRWKLIEPYNNGYQITFLGRATLRESQVVYR